MMMKMANPESGVTKDRDVALSLGTQQVRAKLIVSFLLLIFAGVLPFYLPSLKYPNHFPIFVILNLNFWAAVVFRLLVAWRRRGGQEHSPVIAVESIYDAATASFFIHYLGGINGPLFFFFALVIMLSAMNLVTFVPYVIAFEQGLFTVGEFVWLAQLGQMPVTIVSVIQLLLRLVFLLFIAQFSNGLAASILQERTKGDEIIRKTQEIEEANLKLKSLDKIKSNLLNMASHELRTPATSVRNSLLMLEKYGEDKKMTEAGQRYLESAVRASDRLSNLIGTINQLLETTTGEIVLDISPVQLELIVEEALESKATQAKERGIELEFKKVYGKTVPEIQADEAKVKFVVWELLTNALKYTEAGRITVKVAAMEEYVMLSVTDTGVGMPQAVVEILLKEGFVKGDFFHKSQEGLGLGLYTVKKIVDLHKGKIEIESRLGAGTSVKVYFPY